MQKHIIQEYQFHFKEDKHVFPFTTNQACSVRKVLKIQNQAVSLQPVRKSLGKHGFGSEGTVRDERSGHDSCKETQGYGTNRLDGIVCSKKVSTKLGQGF